MMATGGRRKTPTALAELRGRPSHKKINRREPRPHGNLHGAPKWMSKDQREEWEYIVEGSVPGLLAHVDRSNLTTFIVATCLHRDAAIELNKGDPLWTQIGERGAFQMHPAFHVLNKQALILLRAAVEMGFTPASRTRIEVNAEAPPPSPGKPLRVPRETPGSLAAFANSNPDENDTSRPN